MGRSVKKGPFVQPALYKKVEAMNEKGEKKVVKTWSRSSTIFPEFVGHTFAVHDLSLIHIWSSRATGPKIRVPLGLLSAITITAAFSSKRM